jgi:hypothetical protein
MKHVRPLGLSPEVAQIGQVSLLEQLVLLVLPIVYEGNTNLQAVLQNLQKYYQKTP